MPNRSSDALFQLIKALKKSEKRNFKLFAKRNTGGEEMKIVQLFDALDKLETYDEEVLLKKNKAIRKQQLSNTKALLYRQILGSLRILKSDENVEMQLHEQLDHAKLLYNKGLYLQSLKLLDKIKEQATVCNQPAIHLQVLFFEQKIEGLHITRSLQDRAEKLAEEVQQVVVELHLMGQLSNLSLQLYSWYIKNGHARNEADAKTIKSFFESHLPAKTQECTGFYERLYLYQSYAWYAFIVQDFLLYYRYTQKWVELFEKEVFMIEIETAHYIKGMHNLLGAHFDLQNYKPFLATLNRFEAFSQSKMVQSDENNRIQTFLYVHISKINRHFLEGTFTQGLPLVTFIEDKLAEFGQYIDRHRILVFYYKFASLYFGSGNYEMAISYLNQIINWKVDLRTDLQCYSRLLHLIAHYELGNFQLLEYLIKSVYRFMAKMGNLSLVEEEIFKFLRRSFNLTPKELGPQFENLLSKLKAYEKNRFETRAFAYLDIISWLESKLQGVPVQEIIRQKFIKNIKNK